MENREIAAALYELATLYELDGREPFKVRAFRRAADAVATLERPAEELLRAGALTEVPGIGEGVAARVDELSRTGELHERGALAARFPAGLTALMAIEGLGPKTARRLHDELGIAGVAELVQACRDGRVRKLTRLGEQRERKILEAALAHERRSRRTPFGTAVDLAATVMERLRGTPEILRMDVAGSVRRACETVGDVDLLAAVRDDEDARALAGRFVSLPGVEAVLARGATRSSVRLREGVQVDLRTVPAPSWGAALHYFTGSKAHNIQIRAEAVRRGLKVNEYGIYRVDEQGRELARVGGERELEVFRAVGLPWIPPELREGRGEIEAAAAGRLPALVEARDLRGDLHSHTTETDGRSTLEEMAAAAAALGREYLAITDHSQALAFTRGLDPERLRAQGRAIRALEARRGDIHLLRGIEADILADGAIDLGPGPLAELDVVVGSVHSRFGMSRGEMTRRIVRAIEGGLIDVLGHPTGRLLGVREPYEIDLEAVAKAAAGCDVALELDAYPDRLDLSADACRLAIGLGARISIDSDAHHTRHLSYLGYGVRTARRGWVEARSVVTTWRYRELADWLRGRRGGRRAA